MMAERPASHRVSSRLAGTAVASIAYLSCLGALAALALADAGRQAGPTGAAQVAGYVTATLAGAICLGGLALTVITAQPDDRGVLDPAAFRTHLMVERLSLVWLATSAVMVVVQASADAGVGVGRLLRSGGLGATLSASESARGWLTTAVCAAALALAVRLSVRWEWHLVMLVPALVGTVAVPVTGNAGQGIDHDYATSTVIVFAVALALWAGLTLVRVLAGAPPLPDESARRVAMLSAAAAAVALVFGGLLLALLAGSHVLGTGFGRFGLVAGAALLAGLIAELSRLRTQGVRAWTPLGSVLAVAAVVAVSAVSAMAVRTAPRLLDEQPTVWDILLGYQLPGPPTPMRLMTFWRFDTFLGSAALALAAVYLIAVVRLRRRGDSWPVGRLVAWLAGCLLMIVATSTGVRAYGSAMFSVHMAEHMTLNMFVPVLMVLGAPATLALRALPAAGSDQPPGPREWILQAVHASFTRFLSHPVPAFLIFVGSLYAVYFTPLFDTFVRYHWGHELLSLHFIVTGYLFFWGIIGIDPGPRRLPFIGRLGLLFAIMPFHAFFGIALMTMNSAIGGNFYRSLALPWVPNIIEDQNLGGAIAWGSSELPILAVAVALIYQWVRQDRRVAVRADRHATATYADDELEAYNAMLRELAKTRR